MVDVVVGVGSWTLYHFLHLAVVDCLVRFVRKVVAVVVVVP